MRTAAIVLAVLASLAICNANKDQEFFRDTATFRRALQSKNVTEMAKFCFKPANRNLKQCKRFLQSQELFQDLAATHEELQSLLGVPKNKCKRNGTKSESEERAAPYSAWNSGVARRLAQYSKLLRCKFDRVASWTCTDCVAMGQTTLLKAYQDNKIDPDGFIVNFDQQLNSIVLVIRSTYCGSSPSCISSQWFSNAVLFATAATYPNGQTYQVHSGIYNAWTTSLKSVVLDALEDALKKYPLATHNGIQIVGHSRGAALATFAAVDVSFAAARLGLTNPTEQIKLTNFGSPRVGDAAFASLVESLFLSRFRVVSGADIVTSMAPTGDFITKISYLLGDYGPFLQGAASSFNFYTHWGPQALILDLKDSYEEKICNDGECPVCSAASILSIPFDRKWEDSLFSRIFLDHGWYMQLDMQNANCQNNGKKSYID